MRKIILLLFAVLAAVLFSPSAFAESGKIYIWDGESDFASGFDYSVRSAVTIEKELVVPEGMTLYIRSDGKLTLEKGARLVVRGTLKINGGGVLRSFGEIEIGEKGAVNVFGEMVTRVNTELLVKGALNVFSDGYFNSLGDVLVEKNARVFVGGRFYLRENAQFKNLGAFSSAQGSVSRIYGAMTAEINSSADIYGGFSVTEGAVLTVSGAFTISEGAEMTLSGALEAGADAEITVGGTLEAEKTSSLSLFGRLAVAENGRFGVFGGFEFGEGSVFELLGRAELADGVEAELLGTLTVQSGARLFGKGSLKLTNKLGFENLGTVRVSVVKPQVHFENGVAYVGSVLLVNKQYPLPSDYGDGLKPEVTAAYNKMKAESGFEFAIMSGFRSYSYQIDTFNHWVLTYGRAYAERVSALPGTSEHQTGLALDVGGLTRSYANTDEGKWLAANCWKYGFIIRFPKNCERYTGYSYEPWHIRYVGAALAKQIFDSGLCLEQFLGLTDGE